MAKDSSLFVRRAAIVALKAAAPVAAIVAERVYPLQRPAKPEWPFVAYGSPIIAPYGASCLDGQETTVAVHGYAMTTGEGPATKPGEDIAHNLVAAIASALDGATIDLAAHGCPYPATAFLTHTQSQVLQDNAEGSAFHAVASFRITVSS